MIGMKTGDSFSDDHGQTWTVDAALGRGVWARTWAIRGPGGATAVLKTPLRQEELGDRPDAPALAAHARTVGLAVRKLLIERGAPWLPPVIGLPASADAAGDAAGEASFITARYQADLESRLQAGMELGEVVDQLAALAALIARPGSPVHGNLHPSNLLMDADSRPVLVDPRPEGVDEAWSALVRAVPGRVSYLPPEAEGAKIKGPLAGWDAWAICQLLHRATHAAATSDDPRRGHVIEPPRGGISRVALATLKDAAAARLRDESANLRFAARATDRLGAVLSRGLSLETDPSPPYRFRHASELHPRLAEVADLIHPSVTSVSKPTLEGSAKDGVIEAGGAIELAVNISTTSGVTAQEDIACGVQLRDLDAPDQARVRVPNARFTVKTYPSGRFRFHFTLPDVVPGRYQARVAFSVKGSEVNAMVAECAFQVRPHVGYVPPPAPTPAAPPPLPFQAPGRSAASNDAPPPPRMMLEDDGGDAQVAEVIQFPRRGGPPAPIRPAEGEEAARDDRGLHEPPTVMSSHGGQPGFGPTAGPEDGPRGAHPASGAPAAPALSRAEQPAANGGAWNAPPLPTPRALAPLPPEPPPAGPPPLAAHIRVPPGTVPPGVSTPPAPASPANAAGWAASPAGEAWRAPGAPLPVAVPQVSVAPAPPPLPTAAELPPLAERGLQDYPTPGLPGTFGTDLPIYEAPPNEHTPIWKVVWGVLVRQTGDAFSAFMALVASALGLLIIVAMLARSC
jgi:hypothetical protein